MHQRAIEIGREPDEVIRFDRLRLYVAFLPFVTHVALSQLILTYAGAIVDDRARRTVVAYITGLIFRPAIDRVAERSFISFLLLFGDWVLTVPPAEQLFASEDKRLYRVKDNIVLGCDGPSEIEREKLQPLTRLPDLQELVFIATKRPRVPDLTVFHEMADRLQAAKAAVWEICPRDPFGPCDFDQLFVEM